MGCRAAGHRTQAQIFAAVSAVRRALRDGGHDPIGSAAGGYRLTVGEGELDLDAFHDRLDAARHEAAVSPARAAETIRAAMRLWQGAPLSGITGAFVEVARAGLEERRVEALERLSRHELAAGRHRAVLAELTELVAAHPFSEALVSHLILALHRSGRSADALSAFRETRRRLVAELGIEPTAELELLHKQVLADDPALRCAPPPAPAAPRRRFLPRDIPDFVGRTTDLAELDALAQAQDGGAGAVLITTVAGTAGVGKTALAVHWAHGSAERYPDGQLYVNLRGYDADRPMRPIEALNLLLRALDTPAGGIPFGQDEAAAAYRSAVSGKRLLVLLDNASGVEQVRPLLPSGPGSLALITSRDRLAGLVARDGARRLTLDLLTPGDAEAMLAGMLGAARVAAEPRAAEELAAACGYLPLALRIAAADLADRPEHSIARQVALLTGADRLAVLELDGDPLSTVRAVFAHSYNSLSPAERRAFRLLGAVPGADLPAGVAAALFGVDDAEAVSLLERLTNAHLVTQSTPGRYALHDLLRDYAVDRLRAHEFDGRGRAALLRLQDYYREAAEAAVLMLQPEMLRLPDPPSAPVAAGLPTFATPADALAWLDSEVANLVALVTQATATGPRSVAWQLGHALRPYLWQRMNVADWAATAQAALSAAELEGDDAARATAHVNAGDLCCLRSSYDEGLAHFTAALELVQRCGWLEFESIVEAGMAATLMRLGRTAESVARLSRALAIDEQTGRSAGRASKFGNLAAACWELGRVREAAAYYERAYEVFATGGVGAGMATALTGLAHMLYELGDYQAALQRAEQSLTLHESSGNRLGRPGALIALASSRRALGDHTGALAAAEDALSLAREIGYRRAEADAHDTLAGIHLDLDHLVRAESCGRRACGWPRTEEKHTLSSCRWSDWRRYATAPATALAPTAT